MKVKIQKSFFDVYTLYFLSSSSDHSPPVRFFYSGLLRVVRCRHLIFVCILSEYVAPVDVGCRQNNARVCDGQLHGDVGLVLSMALLVAFAHDLGYSLAHGPVESVLPVTPKC